MPEPLDLRTEKNHWTVTVTTPSGYTFEVVNTPYDAWLRQRTVTPDGRTLPDQASFFAGWDALKDWLTLGLGLEGRLSEYERRAAHRRADDDGSETT